MGRAHGVGSGANAHPWVDAIRSFVDDSAEPVVWRPEFEPPEHALALMRTLGVEVCPVTVVNQDVRVRAGVGGTITVMSAYCPTCRLQASPNDSGCCSFCGTLIVDEDSLSTKAMRAQLAQGDEATSGPGHPPAPAAVSERPCRTDGCPNEANTRYGRGPYSGLCVEVCIPASRERISKQQRAAHAARRGRRALPDLGPEPLAQQPPLVAAAEPRPASPGPLVGELGSGSEIFDGLAVDVAALRLEADRLNGVAVEAGRKRDALEQLIESIEGIAA